MAQEEISFNYDILGDIKNKSQRILLVLDERTTKVMRGENRNRTLQNSNIVIWEAQFLIEQVSGSTKISIPKIAAVTDKLNLIVLVENLEHEITGASKKTLVREE